MVFESNHTNIIDIEMMSSDYHVSCKLLYEE